MNDREVRRTQWNATRGAWFDSAARCAAGSPRVTLRPEWNGSPPFSSQLSLRVGPAQDFATNRSGTRSGGSFETAGKERPPPQDERKRNESSVLIINLGELWGQAHVCGYRSRAQCMAGAPTLFCDICSGVEVT
jgi:hypothetical protein